MSTCQSGRYEKQHLATLNNSKKNLMITILGELISLAHQFNEREIVDEEAVKNLQEMRKDAMSVPNESSRYMAVR